LLLGSPWNRSNDGAVAARRASVLPEQTHHQQEDDQENDQESDKADGDSPMCGEHSMLGPGTVVRASMPAKA
jgi:hypothetical protein